MAKLTDKQKKKIIADYVECGNYSAVARKYKVAVTTVKRVVNSDNETLKKVSQKKEENTIDIFNYLDNKANAYKDYTDYLFDRLNPNDEKTKAKLNEISEMQLVTMFGVLTDKLLKAKEVRNKVKTEGDLTKIGENLISLANILLTAQPPHTIDDSKEEAAPNEPDSSTDT